MNFTILGAVLCAAIGLGGWIGQHFTAMHYEHLIEQARVRNQKQVDEANAKAEDAATSYEAFKAKQRPRTITVTREVQREVQSDSVCADKPLPDGLRAAIAAAAAGQGQPGPDGAVPAAGAARGFDLGGLGARLRGSAGLGPRLPGAASSPQ